MAAIDAERTSITRHDPADPASTERAANLTAAWIAAGYVVESARGTDGWWHRRISPEIINDVRIPHALMVTYATVESCGKDSAETLGGWLAEGHMVTSRLFGAGWFNQVAYKAAAR